VRLEIHCCGNREGDKLLTREEYGTLAADMEFATLAFVDGGYRPAKPLNTFASLIQLLAQNWHRMRPSVLRT
jgi:hypothetical protein